MELGGLSRCRCSLLHGKRLYSLLFGIATGISKIVASIDNGTAKGYHPAMSEIALAAQALIKKHKGLRAACRATGIDPGYLSRLKNGAMSNPSETVLTILGLERVARYRKARKPK